MNVVVGVADMKITANGADTLTTYSLGSCIGITLYDPLIRIGGILHLMLPNASLDRSKAKKNPYMFADTGIPAFLEAAREMGAEKYRLKIVVAGGARIMDPKGVFNIGQKNYLAVKEVFNTYRLSIDFEDVGGDVNRTIRLFMPQGSTIIQAPGAKDRCV